VVEPLIEPLLDVVPEPLVVEVVVDAPPPPHAVSSRAASTKVPIIPGRAPLLAMLRTVRHGYDEPPWMLEE
jgi:hypothetical protein